MIKFLRSFWCFSVHSHASWRKIPNEVQLDWKCDRCGREWVFTHGAPGSRDVLPAKVARH